MHNTRFGAKAEEPSTGKSLVYLLTSPLDQHVLIGGLSVEIRSE